MQPGHADVVARAFVACAGVAEAGDEADGHVGDSGRYLWREGVWLVSPGGRRLVGVSGGKGILPSIAPSGALLVALWRGPPESILLGVFLSRMLLSRRYIFHLVLVAAAATRRNHADDRQVVVLPLPERHQRYAGGAG